MRAQEAAPRNGDSLIAITCVLRSVRRWRIWGEYEESLALLSARQRAKDVRIASMMRHPMDIKQPKVIPTICTADFFYPGVWGAVWKIQHPIFIVGRSRSGSTQVEQILASHSKGRCVVQELPEIELGRNRRGKAMGSAMAPGFTAVRAIPGDVGRIWAMETFVRSGEALSGMRRWAYRKGRPFFIDKMPNNFRHIGSHPSDVAQGDDHRCVRRDPHGLLV